MALKRYRFDWLFALCSIFSMAAFLTPMLTILGVRDGVVGTLTDRLLQNPRNLELTPSGTQDYQPDFFDGLRAKPDAAFVIPETRTLSATMVLKKKDFPPFQTDLSATAPGDPLLAHVLSSAGQKAAGQKAAGEGAGEGAGWDGREIGLREVFVSEALAKKLSLVPGEKFVGEVSRSRGGDVSRNLGGEVESAEVELTVLGILPQHLIAGYRLLCSLELLSAAEDYRSGWEAQKLGWTGGPRPDAPPRYARFRLYAKDLDGVERLRAQLAAEGVETRTQAAQIALVKSLDRAFTVVFAALFLVAGLGAFASVVSGSIDQVAKMRRSLAVLALLGFSKFRLLIFTMIQAALTGLLASAAAAGLFMAIAEALNSYFGGAMGLGESVCRLAPEKLAVAAAAMVFFMTVGSGCAYVKLAAIEPSEGLRDV
ncbi:MAG: hypothetical protein LBU12_08725 [Deltaproteobacteria bacterium]|nr:hypothetical protein [Deltaproteobacteria bacterium]